MSWLLTVCYLLLLVAISPYLLYVAIRKGKYREGFAAKLLGRVPIREGDRPCVWFHAVSVGEVNLLATLIHAMRCEMPDWECVISTTTMTGFALAKKKYAEHTVFYCPLDFSWAVHQAMRRIRPKLLVLAELELWPNLIQSARRHGVKTMIVNGRLSENSFRGYQRIRPLMRHLLRSVDLIAVQNATYADRFRQLGAEETTLHVTGSIKFDGAQTDRNNPTTRQLKALAGITDDDVVFLAGSTQAPEESLALATYQTLRTTFPQLRLILVPRHPDRFNAVADLLDASGLAWQRRTQLDERNEKSNAGNANLATGNKTPDKTPSKNARILLVDGVGELGAWWGTAHIAFVGGSMGQRGGQNMIEPAGYGAAISFGPNTKNFRNEVAMLREADAATIVQNGEELTAFVKQCLENPDFAQQQGQRAREVVAQQLGATDRTIKLMQSLD